MRAKRVSAAPAVEKISREQGIRDDKKRFIDCRCGEDQYFHRTRSIFLVLLAFLFSTFFLVFLEFAFLATFIKVKIFHILLSIICRLVVYS